MNPGNLLSRIWLPCQMPTMTLTVLNRSITLKRICDPELAKPCLSFSMCHLQVYRTDEFRWSLSQGKQNYFGTNMSQVGCSHFIGCLVLVFSISYYQQENNGWYSTRTYFLLLQQRSFSQEICSCSEGQKVTLQLSLSSNILAGRKAKNI